MSTGGIATLMHATPHQFNGLRTIGIIIYLFTVVALVTLILLITHRFLSNRGSLLSSVQHPTEGLFLPTFFLSVYNIFAGAAAYGVPSTGHWLVTALYVCFWIYLAVTFMSAVAQYWYLFTAPVQRLTIQSMTPAWLLPIFPLMLSGTFASTVAPLLEPEARINVIVAGVTCQGLGWSVSFAGASYDCLKLTSHDRLKTTAIRYFADN